MSKDRKGSNPNKCNLAITGKARKLLASIQAELQARDDVMRDYNDPEVGHALLEWAISEHLEGRGPWPKR